ncbi:MAG: hypothetical protein ACQEP3_01040 [Patescibacteria group bacterium]
MVLLFVKIYPSGSFCKPFLASKNKLLSEKAYSLLTFSSPLTEIPVKTKVDKRRTPTPISRLLKFILKPLLSAPSRTIFLPTF